MADETKLQRQATALAWAARFGLASAHEKYDVEERTFRNWRHQLKTDDALRALYDAKVKMLEAVAVDDAAEHADAPTPRVYARGGAPRVLTRAVEKQAAACARLAGLPAVERVSAFHRLPSHHVVDLVLFHTDGRYSFCAVVSDGWAAPRALGHLLFCYAGAGESYRERGDIRLAVFADCEVSPLWLRAAVHVGLPIPFVNVSDLVRET
jgi:hypothetical protein